MKRFVPLLLTAALLLGSGCTAPAEAHNDFFAMNTPMRISVYGQGGEDAAKAARAEVDRLDHLLARTLEKSELAQLNRSAGSETPVPIGPELTQILSAAREISSQLSGTLSVTIAPVKDAWGNFTGEEHRVPDSEELNRLLPLVDDAALLLDPEKGTALLPRKGMAIDLGAIAKGYAASRAEAILRDAGVQSALLDLGHNITVIGRKPDGSPWRVGVIDPRNTQGHLGSVTLTDRTCSTSGGYERGFEANGVWYHHILDPKTGYPAQSGLQSVTVIAQDAMLADALSTALFVAGKETALQFWRERQDFELILCGADNVITVTEGLEETFQPLGADAGYTYEIARR